MIYGILVLSDTALLCSFSVESEYREIDSIVRWGRSRSPNYSNAAQCYVVEFAAPWAAHIFFISAYTCT